ncbi:MAG: cell division protein ZapA [Candidatus Sedimenticola sp. (ex Thyasira tokunagai)]
MSENTLPINVRILDKEYRIACASDEESSLISSARLLDQKMREIRASGKVIGTDRIAVMAALNLAHELLDQQSVKTTSDGGINKRLQTIQAKIDIALSQENQLDL